jgi:hypothetical protein
VRVVTCATLTVLVGSAACTTSRPPAATSVLEVPPPGPAPQPAPPPGMAHDDAGPGASVVTLPDGGNRAPSAGCEGVTDVDIVAATRDLTCVVQQPAVEAPRLPDALRVKIDAPRVKVGAAATVRVSLVNTGDAPLAVTVDDTAFDVKLADSSGRDPNEVRGACLIGGRAVLQLPYADVACGGAYLRFVLAPGGSIHRDYIWRGTRYRWGTQAGPMSCERVATRPIEPGRYSVHAEARVFNYGPADDAGAPAAPLPHVPPATAWLVVSP